MGWGLSSLQSFGSAFSHTLRMCFLLLCKYKWAVTQSCNTGSRAVALVCSLLQIFVVTRQNRGNYTLPQHLWCHFSEFTGLKQPLHGPSEEEAKYSRSPTRQKLPRWKLNAKKTQCRGSDKEPSLLETGTAKNELSRKLTQLSLGFQKTSI